jgi:hypothetical protein
MLALTADLNRANAALREVGNDGKCGSCAWIRARHREAIELAAGKRI